MMAASEETSCIPQAEEALPSKNIPQAMSVTLESECKELWRQFDSIGTEMIVTRRGRYVLDLVLYFTSNFLIHTLQSVGHSSPFLRCFATVSVCSKAVGIQNSKPLARPSTASHFIIGLVKF